MKHDQRSSAIDRSPLIVVALGGNAISIAGTEGNIAEQFAQSRDTACVLADTLDCGYRMVLTHGNGPQVGNILRRVEIASDELYPIPLEVCVADTQAGMGYMLGQCLMNELHRRGQEVVISTIVTTVLVDESDSAFGNPTKPIGPRMSKANAELHEAEDGWQIHEVGPDQFRRIVPSPYPKRILELDTIRSLVQSDKLVICCGGGGIPVLQKDGVYEGIPAVIDKDRTSALLASQLGADRLVILTEVESACTDFGASTQAFIGRITVSEVEELIEQGQFAAGSMLPKMEAAIEFVQTSGQEGAETIITRTDKLLDALEGKTGTRVVV